MNRSIGNSNIKLSNIPAIATRLRLSGNIFWTEDPSVLISKNQFYKIFPTENMTSIQKLNAWTRFFFLFIILAIIFNCQVIGIIALIGVVIIIIYYNMYKNDPIKLPISETFQNSNEKNELPVKSNITNKPIANDFAKWVYDTSPNCKENQEFCLKYEDVRFNR